MKKMLMLSLILVVTSASAYDFPGPNSFGIYASEVDGGSTLTTSTGFEEITMYLLATNLDTGNTLEGLSGWECAVVVGGTEPTAGGWTIPAGGINVLEAPDFQVGYGIGGNALMEDENGVVLLATYTGYVVVPAVDSSTYTITPCSIPSIAGYPVIVGPNDAGNQVACVPNSGDFPSFTVNGDDVIANNDSSFGAVKALFN